MRYMERDQRKDNWTNLEQNMVQEWYFVQKIMGNFIPKTFPYLTYKGLVDSIKEDPNFKKKENN